MVFDRVDHILNQLFFEPSSASRMAVADKAGIDPFTHVAVPFEQICRYSRRDYAAGGRLEQVGFARLLRKPLGRVRLAMTAFGAET
jgi:hypothetical protein